MSITCTCIRISGFHRFLFDSPTRRTKRRQNGSLEDESQHLAYSGHQGCLLVSARRLVPPYFSSYHNAILLLTSDLSAHGTPFVVICNAQKHIAMVGAYLIYADLSTLKASGVITRIISWRSPASSDHSHHFATQMGTAFIFSSHLATQVGAGHHGSFYSLARWCSFCPIAHS